MLMIYNSLPGTDRQLIQGEIEWIYILDGRSKEMHTLYNPCPTQICLCIQKRITIICSMRTILIHVEKDQMKDGSTNSDLNLGIGRV
jgi:hypothetical protein